MHGDEASALRLIGHSDLNGHGDGMQLISSGDALYVAHVGPSGMGTTILNVSDASNRVVVRQWEAPANSHTHKVQVADGLLLTNHERFRSHEECSAGMAVYDLADPFDPKQIGFWESTGDGVHRIVYEGGPNAYLSATPEGYNGRIWMIIDLDDPTHPRETGRWAQCLHENRPGSYRSEELLFVTYFNADLRVYDIAKPGAPVDIAWYIPECPPGQEAVQINDVWVGEDLLVYITDRENGGVYILEPDQSLSDRMREAAS